MHPVDRCPDTLPQYYCFLIAAYEQDPAALDAYEDWLQDQGMVPEEAKKDVDFWRDSIRKATEHTKREVLTYLGNRLKQVKGER